MKRYRKPIWMDKVAFRSCQRRNKIRRINRQSKTAESLANYLSSVEIAKNEKKRSRLDFERKLGYNIKTDSKSLYAYVRSKSRSKDSACSMLDSTDNLNHTRLHQHSMTNSYLCLLKKMQMPCHRLNQ